MPNWSIGENSLHKERYDGTHTDRNGQKGEEAGHLQARLEQELIEEIHDLLVVVSSRILRQY